MNFDNAGKIIFVDETKRTQQRAVQSYEKKAQEVPPFFPNNLDSESLQSRAPQWSVAQLSAKGLSSSTTHTCGAILSPESQVPHRSTFPLILPPSAYHPDSDVISAFEPMPPAKLDGSNELEDLLGLNSLPFSAEIDDGTLSFEEIMAFYAVENGSLLEEDVNVSTSHVEVRSIKYRQFQPAAPISKNSGFFQPQMLRQFEQVMIDNPPETCVQDITSLSVKALGTTRKKFTEGIGELRNRNTPRIRQMIERYDSYPSMLDIFEQFMKQNPGEKTKQRIRELVAQEWGLRNTKIQGLISKWRQDGSSRAKEVLERYDSYGAKRGPRAYHQFCNIPDIEGVRW